MSNHTFKDFLPYLPLCKLAWEEVSKEPFNPNLELFEHGFENGLIWGHIEEAGFYIFAVNTELFTSKIKAEVFTVWVKPEYRNTPAAARILRRLLKDAKSKGAQSIIFNVPVESENIFSWRYHFGNPIDFVFMRDL